MSTMHAAQISQTEFEIDLYASDMTVAREIITGLAKQPKQSSPKYFYDQKGSELFDHITQLDEYYIPRVERDIFADNLVEICAEIGTDCAFIEPGAGACEKVRWLLPELAPSVYMPMDISAVYLHKNAALLADAYPELVVKPVVLICIQY